MQKRHLHPNSHLQRVSVVWPASSCWFGTVHVQFRGAFVPISLGSILRIVAAHVLGIVWSSVVNFFTWYFGIYKTVHRTRLRILSITLEKELKALTVLDDRVIVIQSPWLFSFVSAFLTSLTKLILWLKFSPGKRHVEDTVGSKDHVELLRFSKMYIHSRSLEVNFPNFHLWEKEWTVVEGESLVFRFISLLSFLSWLYSILAVARGISL